MDEIKGKTVRYTLYPLIAEFLKGMEEVSFSPLVEQLNCDFDMFKVAYDNLREIYQRHTLDQHPPEGGLK